MICKIMLEVGVPDSKSTNSTPPKSGPSIEEQIRYALDCIDSGHKSGTEWLLVNKMYKKLKTMKQTSRVRNLINMIEPVLSKFGYHGVHATEDK